ncbi:hypothetical protein PsorP6_007443 [Peronosclerospora sorghi]|uniref:Uncharacterized protein n=1 Tax=Peronosclerospora sorghi TaxID=230839 RepID=A0ACC0WBY1_9STRA|nr:hypothetical protein PsorP6_007443 [Peronosclerospora sorghi]
MCTTLTLCNVFLQPSFMNMRQGKERWTHADDKRLGRALLTVFEKSGDTIVMSDNCALWKRVQQCYQELVAAEKSDNLAVPRSAHSLHTRWARGIRPDMILFASLVKKTQKDGKSSAKSIKEANKLFQGQRSEINAAAVRQFVKDRQRTPTTSGGDSDTDSARPKLKFESFHFRHCYDILCSNPAFLEALMEKGKKNSQNKRRRTEERLLEEYSSSTSKDESDAGDDFPKDEEPKLAEVSQYSHDRRAQVTKVASSTRKHVHQQPTNSKAVPNGTRTMGHPSKARISGSVVISCEDARCNFDANHLKCDRSLANEYVRLHMQILKKDRRLKLLAELRGVVATISQLAQQFAWNGVASAALAARTEGVHHALDQDVLGDIAFFRREKHRLKLEIAALDDPHKNNMK